ncbi:YybH family protein [Rhizobium mesosinicum]|uniref:Nuclear transport factor 2 family protein n=1 Tax=Rhizobium mesosinicum TaxID=335017 RepID=A0ABS7GNT7_9HYPH|nr:nuclear transport factor 2 family protein [Rhizobium mesosinicum]MBW9051070.1 nuclear transport factor 2 family protein [Rhizobium mesosinicum]
MSDALSEIRGNEIVRDHTSALAALVRFYRAFNERDIEALEANWAQSDEPSMDNPIGGIRRGWGSIRAGYMRLFQGPATVTVTFRDFTLHNGTDYCLFVGREAGSCETPDGIIDLRIRTSRLFVRSQGSWRQLHHHGSIDEPAMLAEYQRAIFGANA